MEDFYDSVIKMQDERKKNKNFSTELDPVLHYCKGDVNGMWYYDVLDDDGNGKLGHGPTIYKALLRNARSRIYIWDPYLHKEDAYLFKKIASNIKIRILTCFHPGASMIGSPKRTQDQEEFIKEIRDHHKNLYMKLSIIDEDKLKKEDIADIHIMHDRFLFIDDRVFIVGASMNYFSIEGNPDAGCAKASTLIYEVRDPNHKYILQEDFDSFWDDKPQAKYVSPLL